MAVGMSTLERAIEIAAQAHPNKKDKGGDPYIPYPLPVMLRLPTDGIAKPARSRSRVRGG